MDCQLASPLFGDLVARPVEAAIRYHLTSGTTGRTPLRVLDCAEGLEVDRRVLVLRLPRRSACARTDIVFFAFSYGTFIGFWGAHYAAEKMGCLVLPSGNMTTPNRVQLIDGDGRHRRVRDADLRAAPRAGGARDGHRPRRSRRSSA